LSNHCEDQYRGKDSNAMNVACSIAM